MGEPEPAAALRVLARELKAYSAELAQRPALVVLAKADLLGPDADEQASALARELGRPVLPISALTGAGLAPLLQALAARFPAPASDAAGLGAASEPI